MKIRIIVIIILVFVISISLGLVYLNKVFIPKKLKPLIVSTLANQIQREVRLSSLKYRLFKGFILEDLCIFDGKSSNDKIFLTVKRVNFNISILSFLSARVIVIPSIYLESPSVYIEYRENKTLNIPLTPGATVTKDTALVISQIVISNGRLSFKDETKNPSFLREIEGLNTRLTLSLPESLKFNLQGIILNSDKSKTPFFLKGDYGLLNRSFHLGAKLEDILLAEFASYLPISGLSAHLKELKASVSKEGDSIAAEYSSVVERVDFIKDNLKIAAGLSAKGSLGYNLAKKELDYKGVVDLIKGDIEGIPYLDSANNIKGKLDFARDLVKTDGLSAETLGYPVEISGELSDFKNPLLDIRLKSKLELAKLSPIMKSLLEKNNQPIKFDLEGLAQLDLTLKGHIGDINSLEFTLDMRLSKTKLSLPQLPSPLEEIEGNLKLKKDSLSWYELALRYKDQGFKLTGRLDDFSQPQIETSLTAEDLELQTKFKLQDKKIDITYLEGSYLTSKFNLKGSLDLTDTKQPSLDLQGATSLDLENIPGISKKFAKAIDLPGLRGILTTDFAIKGPLSDWHGLEVSIEGESSTVSLKGLKFSELSLDYKQADSQGRLDLSSKSYKGELDLSANLNLTEKDTLYLANIDIQGIDLAQLKQDTPWKDKNISGVLNASGSLNGRALKLSELSGNAHLAISEGNLWELNLLRGLGKLLFPASFERIIFKEAKGDFVIDNSKVSTNNLKLISSELELAFEGNFDFSGNLNFDVVSIFSEELQKQEQDNLEKVFSSILNQAQQYITVKVWGTFKEPQYKAVPNVKNILDGILGNLR